MTFLRSEPCRRVSLLLAHRSQGRPQAQKEDGHKSEGTGYDFRNPRHVSSHRRPHLSDVGVREVQDRLTKCDLTANGRPDRNAEAEVTPPYVRWRARYAAVGLNSVVWTRVHKTGACQFRWVESGHHNSRSS